MEKIQTHFVEGLAFAAGCIFCMQCPSIFDNLCGVSFSFVPPLKPHGFIGVAPSSGSAYSNHKGDHNYPAFTAAC